MRITKRQLQQIINESLFGRRRLFEDGSEPDQKHSGKGQGLAVYVGEAPEPASDNSSALKVISDETGASTLKAALKALGTSYSGDYYVWSKRNPGKKFVKLGEYYKKGSGDPYTYEKVGEAEGGKTKYRVISGPFNKGKYTSGKLSGKTIGTHPIGAIFTMGQELEPVPQPEPVVETKSFQTKIIYLLTQLKESFNLGNEVATAAKKIVSGRYVHASFGNSSGTPFDKHIQMIDKCLVSLNKYKEMSTDDAFDAVKKDTELLYNVNQILVRAEKKENPKGATDAGGSVQLRNLSDTNIGANLKRKAETAASNMETASSGLRNEYRNLKIFIDSNEKGKLVILDANNKNAQGSV